MIQIKMVQRTMQNRRHFRTLARDNCGESMEPGENEIMYFGYKPSDSEKQGISSYHQSSQLDRFYTNKKST